MRSRLILQRVSSLSHSPRTRWQPIRLLVERIHPVVQGWLLLFRFELIMRFRSSAELRRIVRNCPVTHSERSRFVSTEELSHAMDLACVLYFKRVRCLQRSSATTILLRRYGRKPEMVTGAQLLPYEFHAWVEIDGVVVNDKPYMHEIYQVLERC
jgi:Transglutaminase-like superfamily